MFIGIQIALVVVGLFIMTRGRFHIGDREVGNPVASLVGIILAGQMPLALLIGIVLGLTDDSPAPTIQVPTRAGQPVESATVAAPRSADDSWWVDPFVTCGAILAAAGLTAIALRSAEETEVVFANLRPVKTDAAR